jgi:hypothetical protein
MLQHAAELMHCAIMLLLHKFLQVQLDSLLISPVSAVFAPAV